MKINVNNIIDSGVKVMTIWSNEAKIKKLRWLKDAKYLESMSPIQIQKFLFFSEMFNRNTNEQYSFYKLKAYKNGPVFSDVYGDITYRRSELLESLGNSDIIFNLQEEENLKKALFITYTQSDEDLSEMTHNMDLWKSKEELVNENKRQIPIYEYDITNRDEQLINNFYEYSNDIDDYKVIRMNGKIFLLDRQNSDLFKDEMLQTMELISEDENLINPVYVDIEDGVLLID